MNNFSNLKYEGRLILPSPEVRQHVQVQGLHDECLHDILLRECGKARPYFLQQLFRPYGHAERIHGQVHQPGDENITNVPVIASKRQNNSISNLGIAYNAYNYSDQRIAKGDFIRLKEVSLGYDLPKTAVEKLRLKSLSFKIQGTNLCLLYADKKLEGQDPEFLNAGGVAVRCRSSSH